MPLKDQVEPRRHAHGLESSQAQPEEATAVLASSPPEGSLEQLIHSRRRSGLTGHHILQFYRGGASQGRAVASDPLRAACAGATGAASPLPFLPRLQEAFGAHDLSGVRAHRGQAAQEATEGLGARAYAMGESVVFGEEPDLRLAAHEAAHVVQQRTGAVPTGHVSQPGDLWEQHADQVADAVTSGRSAQPLLDNLRGGTPSAALQREEALENELEVKEGEVCQGLHQEGLQLIEGFVSRAVSLIEVWGSQREREDFDFDSVALEQLLEGFKKRWVELESSPTGPHGEPVHLLNNGLALREVRARLFETMFPQYFKEIRIFNKVKLQGYADLLGVRADVINHHYDLFITVGGEVGVDVGLSVEGAWILYKIKYSNELGMSWSKTMKCESIGIGAGLGVSPISLNAFRSLEGTEVNMGAADSPTYFGRDFFKLTALSYAGAEVSAGAGGGVGHVMFFDSGGRLVFDTSGFSLKLGTNLAGNVGESIGGGYCHGLWGQEKPLKLPDPEAPIPLQRSKSPMISATLYFATEEDQLDQSDIRTLRSVIRAIMEREVDSPGGEFQLKITGSASARWRQPKDMQTAEQANHDLASRRAQRVQQYLLEGLAVVQHHFDPVVFETFSSENSVQLPVTGNSQEDRREDRRVLVEVLYQGCAVSPHGEK